MKKEIYILIGPAAIGKTTFILKSEFPDGKFIIVSRDDIVARVSEKYNLSIDELYQFPPHDSIAGAYVVGMEKYGQIINSPGIVKHLQPFSFDYLDSVNAEINYTFYNEFQSATRNPNIEFIIVDRVHLRQNERDAYNSLIDFSREDFIKIGVLFNFKDKDTLDLISKASEIRTEILKESGQKIRTVPRTVQENMLKFYQPIADGEFDTVLHIDTLPEIRKFIKNK